MIRSRFTVVCDRFICGELTNDRADTPDEAAANAERRGWQRIPQRDNPVAVALDYCPDHHQENAMTAIATDDNGDEHLVEVDVADLLRRAANTLEAAAENANAQGHGGIAVDINFYARRVSGLVVEMSNP